MFANLGKKSEIQAYKTKKYTYIHKVRLQI